MSERDVLELVEQEKVTDDSFCPCGGEIDVVFKGDRFRTICTECGQVFPSK